MKVAPVLRRSSILVALALTAVASTSAHADTIIYASNLSVVTPPTPNPNGNNFQLGYNGGNVPGIYSNPIAGVPAYNFVYAQGAGATAIVTSATSTGASANGGSSIVLDNKLTADSMDTQDHGAFLALDGGYESNAISIFIPVTVYTIYTLTFDYAAIQQTGYTGTATESLIVTAGNVPTVTTPTLTVPQQGFSGWNQFTTTFFASGTGTTVVGFSPVGTATGAGQPGAFTLVDNITVTQKTATAATPEPGSLMLLSTGLIGLGGFVRSRYKN